MVNREWLIEDGFCYEKGRMDVRSRLKY